MGATRNTPGSVEPPDEPERESGIAFAPAKHARDKRRFARSAVTVPVRITHGDGVSLAGSCVNLSRGGMFVQVHPAVAPGLAPAHGAAGQLAAGSALRIWLALDDRAPNPADELFLTGEVRWTHPDGMGIEHSVLDASDTVRLADFLASQQIANPQTSE